MYYIQIQTHLTNVLFCIVVPERLSHVFNILGFFVLKAMCNQYFCSTKTEGILNHAALLSIVLNDAISITSQIILGNLYCHLLSFRYIHWWLNIFSCVFLSFIGTDVLTFLLSHVMILKPLTYIVETFRILVLGLNRFIYN